MLLEVGLWKEKKINSVHRANGKTKEIIQLYKKKLTCTNKSLCIFIHIKVLFIEEKDILLKLFQIQVTNI